MVDSKTDVGADADLPAKDMSPGEMLLQGRLQAGLTQEQVAKELYMTLYKVKALETDDYKRLNSDTFARGYIRAYANLVKIDVVAALSAYDTLMDTLKPPPAAHNPVAATETVQRGAWQFLAVIGAFFVGLWLISVWFFDNHSDTEYVVTSDDVSSVAPTTVPTTVPTTAPTTMPKIPTAVPKTVPTTASPALPSGASANTSMSASVSSLPVLGANNVTTSVVPAAANQAKQSATAVSTNSLRSVSQTSSQASVAVSTPVATSSVAVQSSSVISKKTSLDEVSFTFRGESWLEVSDSRGDVLATELEPAGSKVKLVGVAPFDVKLGNAPFVDIQLNGKKIDVIPLVGSNVLIMKIGD